MPVLSALVSDTVSCFVTFSFQTLTLNPNFMVLVLLPWEEVLGFPVSASLVVTGPQAHTVYPGCSELL